MTAEMNQLKTPSHVSNRETTSLLDEIDKSRSSLNIRESHNGLIPILKKSEPFKMAKFRASKGDNEQLFSDESTLNLKGKNIGTK